MSLPLLLRSLVSLSASARYLSDLIVNLFGSTSTFHSYQSTMFPRLDGSDVRQQTENMVRADSAQPSVSRR